MLYPNTFQLWQNKYIDSNFLLQSSSIVTAANIIKFQTSSNKIKLDHLHVLGIFRARSPQKEPLNEINPHKPKLTTLMIVRISLKCFFFFFFTSYIEQPYNINIDKELATSSLKKKKKFWILKLKTLHRNGLNAELKFP